MPQLRLYVTEEMAEKIKQRASSRRLSVSKYLAELVNKHVQVGWPEGFFDEVVGGWRGTSEDWESKR